MTTPHVQIGFNGRHINLIFRTFYVSEAIATGVQIYCDFCVVGVCTYYLEKKLVFELEKNN
jgi:hypothetical protein